MFGGMSSRGKAAGILSPFSAVCTKCIVIANSSESKAPSLSMSEKSQIRAKVCGGGEGGGEKEVVEE